MFVLFVYFRYSCIYVCFDCSICLCISFIHVFMFVCVLYLCLFIFNSFMFVRWKQNFYLSFNHLDSHDSGRPNINLSIIISISSNYFGCLFYLCVLFIFVFINHIYLFSFIILPSKMSFQLKIDVCFVVQLIEQNIRNQLFYVCFFFRLFMFVFFFVYSFCFFFLLIFILPSVLTKILSDLISLWIISFSCK